MLTIASFYSNFYYNCINHFFQKNSISKERTLFFDIETTGLSHKTSHLYLIGAAVFEKTSFKLYQFLAEHETSEEETALLQSFYKLCSDRDCLIHFNGTTFDIPYLLHKSTQYQVSSPLLSMKSIDLYRTLRPISFLLPVSNFKQRTLEPLCHYQRLDTMDGKQLIQVFHSFASLHKKEDQNLLLLHNHDDIEGMFHLLSLDILKAVLNGKFEFIQSHILKSTTLNGDIRTDILFQFSLPSVLPTDFSYHLEMFSLTFSGHTGKLKLPLLSGTLRYFYKNYKNYYYLPLEDEAVHKSIASYVDSSCRQKAKASNCYKKISGFFLRAYGNPNLSQFKTDYESKEIYIQWTSEFSASPEMQQEFLREFLKNLPKK